MPESRRHMRLRTTLYQTLDSVFAPENTLGCDQFVYFDATDPRRKLAPDAFVKLGVPDHDFDAYLVWEEGTPEVAFEVLSPSDTPERWTFKEKLRRYHALGVRELVCINVDAKAGKRLRVWDRIDQDLVERVVTHDRTPCLVLGLFMLVERVGVDPVALRLARDRAGRDRLLSPGEKLAGATAAIAERDAVIAERE
ncbi:MAG TPA: Uma2 family endonuclease, partial [Labilithrix sp.]|nr:Uma2 family endonuclease [Labilithrix sp.]